MAEIQIDPMRTFLGIDAGGSTTKFTKFDEQGNVLKKTVLDSIHFMRVQKDTMISILHQGSLDCEVDSSTFVACGVAGYGEDSQIRTLIEDAVHRVFPHALIMNDAEFATIGALGDQDGAYVISGTGSIAYLQKNKMRKRIGGWGYLISDLGSAFSIGKEVLEAFTKQADGRYPKTPLFPLIMSHFKLSEPHDLIRVIYEDRSLYRNCVADLAELVYPLAIEGDYCILEIYSRAGKQLAELIQEGSDESSPVAYGGGVLLHNDFVRSAFFTALGQRTILELQQPPEYAALVLGR